MTAPILICRDRRDYTFIGRLYLSIPDRPKSLSIFPLPSLALTSPHQTLALEKNLKNPLQNRFI